MHYFFHPTLTANDKEIVLSEEESFHCMKVLRMRTGTEVKLINGNGLLCNGEVLNLDAKKTTVKIKDCCQSDDNRNFKLHIAIAPTKQIDRFEWFLEKATELGIDFVTPLECEHSERNTIKNERLNKVIISAMKQSGRSHMPVLNNITSFDHFIGLPFEGKKYIAHCMKMEREKPLLKNNYSKGENVLVLIGPEGDFSEKEVELALENGYQEISLGSTRLRTETAAIYACSMINMLN